MTESRRGDLNGFLLFIWTFGSEHSQYRDEETSLRSHIAASENLHWLSLTYTRISPQFCRYQTAGNEEKGNGLEKVCTHQPLHGRMYDSVE